MIPSHQEVQGVMSNNVVHDIFYSTIDNNDLLVATGGNQGV